MDNIELNPLINDASQNQIDKKIKTWTSLLEYLFIRCGNKEQHNPTPDSI